MGWVGGQGRRRGTRGLFPGEVCLLQRPVRLRAGRAAALAPSRSPSVQGAHAPEPGWALSPSPGRPVGRTWDRGQVLTRVGVSSSLGPRRTLGPQGSVWAAPGGAPVPAPTSPGLGISSKQSRGGTTLPGWVPQLAWVASSEPGGAFTYTPWTQQDSSRTSSSPDTWGLTCPELVAMLGSGPQGLRAAPGAAGRGDRSEVLCPGPGPPPPRTRMHASLHDRSILDRVSPRGGPGTRSGRSPHRPAGKRPVVQGARQGGWGLVTA